MENHEIFKENWVIGQINTSFSSEQDIIKFTLEAENRNLNYKFTRNDFSIRFFAVFPRWRYCILVQIYDSLLKINV